MIDVADLAEWIGVLEDSTHDDSEGLLELLEARAVEIVQEATERYFGTSAARTEYRRGNDAVALVLFEQPSAITSVHYRLHVGDDWTAITEGDDDGFELYGPPKPATHGKSRLRRKGGYVWSRAYEYRVIYSFGYASGSEPGDIRQLVMDLVALKYRERGREGLQSQKLGDYSYSTLVGSMGGRDLWSMPGAAATVARWRGATVAPTAL